MSAPDPDIRASDLGAVLAVQPCSDEGERWLADNLVGDNTWIGSPGSPYGVCYVEHRYGPHLLRGAMDDGLVVYLDEEFCDG